MGVWLADIILDNPDVGICQGGGRGTQRNSLVYGHIISPRMASPIRGFKDYRRAAGGAISANNDNGCIGSLFIDAKGHGSEPNDTSAVIIIHDIQRRGRNPKSVA